MMSGMTTPKLSYAQIRDRKKPVTKSLTIALEPDLASAYEDAKSDFEKAQNMSDSNPDSKELKGKLNTAKKAYEAAKTDVLDNSVEFVFKALSRQAVDDIVGDNLPTAKQIEEAESKGEEAAWNPDTFPPALIAASLVSPEMSTEDVLDMWNSDDWNQAELVALFLTALEVNQTRRLVDVSKG